jgi:hypothetical protein
MTTASRIWLSLAGFLLIVGAVYGLTSREFAGAPLLLVGGATFCYLGLVGRAVVRRSERQGEESAPEGKSEVHVASTIWPFAFSVAGAIIVLGFIVSPWILAVGAIAFVISAMGWLRDVVRGHAHTE